MMTYAFETIEMKSFTGKMKTDYRKIVQEYAQKGWRLHSMNPIPGYDGMAASIELIFEREA
ncbi:DUF4177 domain-containing protein [Terribacillus halophilus]|jgi:hypothetical protein|uniref:DUF4177 domain-containing protein n=1 Tax=Terribacillus halophilus TaxID=361279 RepID=UPI000984F817|nr:DUF4177 domain-containing protein [Terribacillus halophilus]